MDQITDNVNQAGSLFTTQLAYVTQTVAPLFDFILRLNFFILLPIFFAVTVFLVGYFKRYQWPAEKLSESLAKVISQIKAARFKYDGAPDQLKAEIDSVFNLSPFKALWQEYDASLHTIQLKDRSGTKAVLATVPAEMFFSKESIVDLQINADFYRHLPGILTGIGIIGTFSGLVWGLHEFKPDPSEALSSLPLLLQEVTSAFLGSGFAILAAIFVTYKEKSILNHCYRLVEDLNKEIDSLYAAGVGEEYLARLVSVSENHLPATIEDLTAFRFGH